MLFNARTISVLGCAFVLAACQDGRYAESGRLDHEQEPSSSRSNHVPFGSNSSEVVVRAGDWLNFPGDEELWVIERRQDEVRPAAEDHPGTGCLMVETSNRQSVALPLEHTDVNARISGFVATVDVIQRFQNPFAEKIEAVYVFPLPHNAAVRDFAMRIGERRIRGIIREREEAQQIYERARSQGLRASLMTQERPNVFTQRVANIEPGHAIEVEFQYLHSLGFVDDAFHFIYPMVVSPRYQPAYSRDALPELSYLPAESNVHHPVALKVEIETGLPLGALRCLTHDIDVQRDEERAIVRLVGTRDVANRDFVLSYRIQGEGIRPSLLVDRGRGGEDGHVALLLVPPTSMDSRETTPREMIFVVDASGSMGGTPLAQTKDAIRLALQTLGPRDAFQILRFSNRASSFAEAPVSATPENVRAGLNYLEAIRSEGGTEMMEGIRAALQYPTYEQRTRYVAFMTDGLISNEVEVLRLLHDHLGGARIFAFGVGGSVNRHLLQSMARIGQGAVAFIGLNEDPREVMRGFYERIAYPALSHVSIDWGALDVHDVQPARIPDLYYGRPVVITAKVRGAIRGAVRIRGYAASERRELRLDLQAIDRMEHPGVACIWARRKLMALDDEAIVAPSRRLDTDALDLALRYSLLSSRTSFLAVDASERTRGSSGVTVPVAAEMPRGVRYSTSSRTDSR